MNQRRRFALFLLILFSLPLCAQNTAPADRQKEIAEWIKANYTKHEYLVPMRDDVRLFTAVYVPKDASAAQRYPLLLTRTPYSVSPYGSDNYPRQLGPSELLLRSKYIFVYQDVRGRFMSEGRFEDMRPFIANKRGRADVDESSDTYDTIEWLLKNVAFHNGRLGQWGISYPGFYAAMGMIDAHPALKASSPQAPIADWFIGDDFHHNGALWLPHFFNFISSFGLPRPKPTTEHTQREFDIGTYDGYNFFLNLEPLSLANEKYLRHHVAYWDELTQHPNYDAFWKARSTPQFIRNIKPAVLDVGGWFDAEDVYGALHTYQAAAKNNPAGPVTLVMGPWIHGGWARTEGDKLGDVSFNDKTGPYYRERIEAPFFEFHLKGKGDGKLPAAYVFETGTNQWRQYDAWPPKNAVKKTLYLCAGSRLTFTSCPPHGAGDAQAGLAGVRQATMAYAEYVSDPAKPVPFVDQTSTQMVREYMTADQRLQGRRTDVLSFQTEPLDQDITVAGPVQPSLFVSTTGTDSDFVVKLIDVYPDTFPDPEPNPTNVHMSGYQQLVRGEVMRGRFRNSYEKPEAFEPGKVTKVEFVEPDVNHTFRRGHRIMVQVQSSWFPLADINPQTFVPSIYEAHIGDFQKATQRVYYTFEAPSHINLNVLPAPVPTPEAR